MKTKKTLKIGFIVLLVMLILTILGGFSVFFIATAGTKLDKNAVAGPRAQIELFDADGNALSPAVSAYAYTDYDQLSPHIVHAFIALEDKRFYKHSGVDYIRLAGATLENVKSGSLKEGGSTITQQLAKNTMLTSEKTLTRKLKEAKLAFQIEKNYEKEEILAMYLNAIYYGNGIYGITDACRVFFNKEPSEITLPEGAILAGIVKSPTRNNPAVNPENALSRMRLVLSLMHEQGFIDETAFNDAKTYQYTPPETEKIYTSYTAAVLEEAARALGITEQALITGGYQVFTYQDAALQRNLENTFKSGTLAVEGADYLSLVADNATHGISAYCASFRLSLSDFKRQPASALKPIAVYAPALESGYISPATPVLDEKTNFYGYSPSNYGDSYLGRTDVRQALMMSSNNVAVGLLNEIGVDYGKYTAEKFGLNLHEQDGLSLALGGLTEGVGIKELTAAYTALANYGMYRPLSFVKEIRDENGKMLYKNTHAAQRVMSDENAYILTDMLKDTANYGTAKKLAGLKTPVAAKTGTAGNANGNTDAWNLSYSTAHTVCSWYGSLQGGAENLIPANLTGGSYPTMLTKHVYQNLPAAPDFSVPSGVLEAEIDLYATKLSNMPILASAHTPNVYRKAELFSSASLPREFSSCFEEAIPERLQIETVEDTDGIRIEFTGKEGFYYKIKKRTADGETVLNETAVKAENGALCYSDTVGIGFGITRYSVEVYTEEGILVGESAETRYFNMGGVLPLF